MNAMPTGKSRPAQNANYDTTTEKPNMSNIETHLSTTDLRRTLVAESRLRIERSRHYMDILKPGADASQADWDAFVGAVGTGTYAWLVAGILRLLEQQHPETATVVAGWVEASLNSGLDWLEDLNGDIDNEPAATAEAGA